MRVIESVARDVRFALRLMRQTPIVSGVALLSLALGIGANVAIFSLVNALLLKPLPVHEPDRLVLLTVPDNDNPGRPRRSFTNPQWEFLRDHAGFMAGMFALDSRTFNLSAGGESQPADGLFVSGRFFDTLGVTPHLGRLLTPADDVHGGNGSPAAVLSHGFWQRQFGGDRDVIGRTLTLDGHVFTIVGVTPPDFLGIDVGRAFDMAVPLGTEAILRGKESALGQRDYWWLRIAARLAPGQTIAEANARVETLRAGLRDATIPPQRRPQDQAPYLQSPFAFESAATGVSTLRTRYSRPLFVLLGIVALVLLIACANMANLLLAQSTARQRELVVRLSLGASRRQLIRQLFVESLLLASLGAVAGLFVAVWASQAIVAMLSTAESTVVLSLELDWRVLGFTAAMGFITALLFGVVPALRATTLSPAAALRNGARTVVAGRSRLSLGDGLVALQVALSFVLVLGAGLFVRTLIALTTQDLGFQTERVLLATIDLRRLALADVQRPAFFERLRDGVSAAPGVQAAAMSVVTPISGGGWSNTILVPGYESSDRDRTVGVNAVTPGYFGVMSTPILAGRDLGPADRLGAPLVGLVNEALARKFFGGESPIGKTVSRRIQNVYHPVEIVGLVADAKYLDLREAPMPTLYLAWSQERTASTRHTMNIRVSGPANAFRSTVLDAIMGVEKEAVVYFQAFEENLRATTLQDRLVASLSTLFGALALLLAALGLYGILSYAVTQRRNEIGIRMALGAEPGSVMRLVFGQVLTVTTTGLIVGVAAAIGAGRFVNALLFQLVATDATMIVAAAVTLAIAAIAAAVIPARRAARIDPMLALREN